MAIYSSPYPYNNFQLPYNNYIWPTNAGPQTQTTAMVGNAQQPMSNIVISVQGLDAAKAYPLSPNTRGYFLDTEEDFIYIKEIGLDGLQTTPVKILRCEEIKEDEMKKKEVVQNNIVTVEMLDQYIGNYLEEHSYRPYTPRIVQNKDNKDKTS